MYRGGIDIGPVTPGDLKCTVSDFYPWGSVVDTITVYIFNLLYAPTSWSDQVNNQVYQIVAAILQLAQDHNVTLSGGAKYNVPSGDFSIDKILLSAIGAAPPQNLTSYALAAISGADNFNDDSVVIKDLFDVIVSNTRQVTASCKFPYLFVCIRLLIDTPRIKSEPCGLLGTHKMMGFPRICSDNSPSYISYKWPVRSVERLPPYTSTQLKVPVLVIGNTVRPFPAPGLNRPLV